MRFQHNEVNFEVRYEDHQNCSKTYFIDFLKVFSDHHIYVIKIDLILSEPHCVKLKCLWTFSIVEVFFAIWHHWHICRLVRFGVKGWWIQGVVEVKGELCSRVRVQRWWGGWCLWMAGGGGGEWVVGLVVKG